MDRLDANFQEAAHESQASPFTYPADGLSDQIRDFFISKFRGDIDAGDASWLALLITDILRFNGQLPGSAKRAAALRMAQVLCEIDAAMAQAKDPSRTWKEIVIALQLPSSIRSQTQIAREHRLSKMAISKSVRKLQRCFDVQPKFYSQ